ncbi:S1 RNA-binding domain-containing protein [Candidatus Peregrinibacteria bacterium]|jgi:small subunit ribosomal protein S1|nr:S1 RNA-binding domain-containing protein [Candidatus Peregrinibacteria bacterium]MBT4148252.1 S1 RNA-binding domain-containing protein [Candidatus Peregrinibacteria bacterium]MBT4366576.1 S1 RNA-binding domain-containing protein [Candidatus Peregrinibacteria bacterium]MBT4456609.1 S1 RNA-binding domain-containing protein [Candidatus Peregrinibacteria bacterium]
MAKTAKYQASSVMEELMEKAPGLTFPKPGSIVEGNVSSILKNKILVDLGGAATGVITGKESHDSVGTVKNLQPEDLISAYVLEEENDDGLVVLSLRRASQEKTWDKFKQAHETGEIIEVAPNEANKGGLLLNIDGIKGFIPVSQLAPMHYPRVDGADSAKILSRLQKLVGVNLEVKVINLDETGGKLILSERAAQKEARQKSLDTLDIGQKVKGKISGIVKFGIFVAFDGLEGLVHISEIAWGHVKDPSDYGKSGDEVEVLVIGKDDDKISLSMKRLIPDPWIEASKNYKVNSTVECEVSRITPFGAFVKLDDEINGLIHISEISDEEGFDVGSIMKMGEKVKAKIISIDADEHRVGLSLKALTAKPKEEVEAKAETSDEAPAEDKDAPEAETTEAPAEEETPVEEDKKTEKEENKE